jgi:hypothetical protein
MFLQLQMMVLMVAADLTMVLMVAVDLTMVLTVAPPSPPHRQHRQPEFVQLAYVARQPDTVVTPNYIAEKVANQVMERLVESFQPLSPPLSNHLMPFRAPVVPRTELVRMDCAAPVLDSVEVLLPTVVLVAKRNILPELVLLTQLNNPFTVTAPPKSPPLVNLLPWKPKDPRSK